MTGAMDPRSLVNAITFDKARELCEVLESTHDADELGEAIEAAASDPDLATAVMYWLVTRVRGWDEQRTGVELAALEPTAADLWTP